MLVGARLKEARKSKNLSQEQLGELLGLSKSAISLYESEKRNPNLENIVEMMYILGVSADYLLGTDVIVEVQNASTPSYQTLTKEEMAFINELRKDRILYEILFTDHKRGVEIIKQRIG
ncbi:MAG: helix-turn-helix transcriptional regulator [Bacilli bacterium]|nr:helix-turn-helix transcriptional regulator [Bacilli bacterium]